MGQLCASLGKEGISWGAASGGNVTTMSVIAAAPGRQVFQKERHP